jgi:hypothetical protein
VSRTMRHILSTTAKRAEAFPFKAGLLSFQNGMAVYGSMFSVGLTQHEGSMAARGFKVILRFSNDVPSMAMCTNCQYKFITPSNLKRDPAGAELYLRHRFESHKCTDEPAHRSH